MKKTIQRLIVISAFAGSAAYGQSSIEFQPGTSIEVTAGADICADAVTINGSFSGEGTQCESALPVELVSFSATLKKGTVVLTWRTETETNNLGFEVERRELDHRIIAPLNQSTNEQMKQWQRIGFMDGHGTSHSPQLYSFVDASARGSVLYRLKQIDRDGSFRYSPEVEVIPETAPLSFALEQNFPNPFNPSTTIGFTLKESGPVSLIVYDAIGREVTVLVNDQLEAGAYHRSVFNASSLANGIYIARLSSGGNVKTLRMLLLK